MTRLMIAALAVVALLAHGAPALAQTDQLDGVDELWKEYPLDPEPVEGSPEPSAEATQQAAATPSATPAEQQDGRLSDLHLVTLIALAATAGAAALRLAQQAAGPSHETGASDRPGPSSDVSAPTPRAEPAPAATPMRAAEPASPRKRRFEPSERAESVPVGAAREPVVATECSIVLERADGARRFAAVLPDGRVLGRSAPFRSDATESLLSSPEAKAAVRALTSALETRGWQLVPGTSRMRRNGA